MLPRVFVGYHQLTADENRISYSEIMIFLRKTRKKTMGAVKMEGDKKRKKPNAPKHSLTGPTKNHLHTCTEASGKM